MSERKQRILATALELFAKESYAAVSTNRIASEADVSEGLIFKHFKNKKGLLDAIIADGAGRAAKIFQPILEETDPAKLIEQYIDAPFNVPEETFDYWRLQFKLKWEEGYQGDWGVNPIKEKLAWALEQLGSTQGEIEAHILMVTMEGISKENLRGQLDNPFEVRAFLKGKYLPDS